MLVRALPIVLLCLVFLPTAQATYYDKETNFHYNYYRDYDPSMGRYIESDPIGLDGGINTFGYVQSNPLRNSDPFGLDIPVAVLLQNIVTPIDDMKANDCFFSCVESHYGVGAVAARAVVAVGAIPINKPVRGIKVLGGASQNTNVVSFYGSKVPGMNSKIGTQIVGTNRWFGLAGRLNLALGLGLLSYDITSVALCMERCVNGQICYVTK